MSRENQIVSVTPRHDAQMVGLYMGSSPAYLNVMAVNSVDSVPQHLFCHGAAA